ncbi:MAG: ATP-grasp domain-containing protein [Treponema sp.]|nr:ATP-grasp domain-containing protein [Treponema sp.]
MKETIIILGAGVMQGPAIEIAKESGFYTVVLDGSSSAPCIGMADRFEQIDLKDKEGIETFARSIQGKTSRLGIMTAGTDFSVSVAWTAEKLGLPGIPYQAALNASDKARMRECFKKAALPSPEFFTITAADIQPCIKSFTPLTEAYYRFPLVIKPVDNMGSRGCRRVDSIDEFEKAAKEAIGFSRSGRAIAENYMDGPEFSVDAIVYRGEITICGLADRHIFFPPYFIEMGHTMPTVIEEEKQLSLLETFRAGVRALGLAGKDNIGAAKGDIKLTLQGPMIGEIAARLSGGYMSGWTYPYSSGALPVKAAILMAMGYEPEGLIPQKKWTCAERAFISIPGTVKQLGIKNEESGIDNGQLVIKMDYINDFFLRIKEGDKVSFPENNVSKCGNIIASAPERETAIAAAENAARSILIKLDPKDSETKEFLTHTETHQISGLRHREDGNFKFPPDAFELTDDLRNTLNLLPEFINTANRRYNSWLIIPFNAFQSSGLKDYMGRTVEETLDAVRQLTGLPLPITCENAENKVMLGRSFWSALIRGSYQGAVYYIDTLGV